ncbi:serine/threonine protein kinase [Tumebacillus permanentifrigoris]|uniref:Serine/threonine protein kinase n=1 Tax=Tumebacillus permanentifrigoris TaxID=378543 RepID=A0A316DTG4_9BACL|nr:serine/threonine-protein kinase [Tumebacillus permanentifrigoris]PWK10299.1 serine/threonine protein kinase [Tumebacillus permanentifrigoris]
MAIPTSSKRIWYSIRYWIDLIYTQLLDRPYRAGKVLGKRYVVERCLGMGSYGISYLCRDQQTGQPCVVKQVRPSKRRGQKGFPIFEYETSILQQLQHPAIPRLYQKFSQRGHWFFAMEYMQGTNLEDALFETDLRYSERQALQLIRDLLEIVAYVHDQRVVHRDVRIPNVILQDGQLKLIDFGLARRLGDRPTQVAEDLRDYVVEKQIKREVEFRSDFYSMGHFLLFLLYTTFESSGEEERSWEEELNLHPATKTLLKRMLQLQSPHFANAAELATALDEAIRAAE